MPPELRRGLMAVSVAVLAVLPAPAVAAPSAPPAPVPTAAAADLNTAAAAARAAANCTPGQVLALTPSAGATWSIVGIDVATDVLTPVRSVVNPGGTYNPTAVSRDDVNRMDALAVTVDGRYAYLTDSDARLVGQTPRIHKVDLDSGAVSTFTGSTLLASTPTVHPGISAGALNTATGVYYYAHAIDVSDNWLVYGWNPPRTRRSASSGR